jgi:hypothetical protein
VENTHKIGKMNMALGIQENIVGLHISMDDSLAMYISKGAAQFGHPEPDRLFGEGFSRNVKAKIATIHKIHHQISDADERPYLEMSAAQLTCIRHPGSCTVDCKERGGLNIPAYVALE